MLPLLGYKMGIIQHLPFREDTLLLSFILVFFCVCVFLKECSLFYVEPMIILMWSYAVESSCLPGGGENWVRIDSDSHLGKKLVLREETNSEGALVDRRFAGVPVMWGLPQWLSSKESACNAEDTGSIPGWGRSPGGGHGNPLPYSCLENPMDRGAWWATVHRVTKSQTQLKWLSPSWVMVFEDTAGNWEIKHCPILCRQIIEVFSFR